MRSRPNTGASLCTNATPLPTAVFFSAASGNRKESQWSPEHISHADWGDFLVVAPATANIIGKFANGIADDALSTTFLAYDKPVFVAPAMNDKMYSHPIVQRNMNLLKEVGVVFIEPTYGELACGTTGKGRMEEPENIVAFLANH